MPAPEATYPVNLVLVGRRCVVVGGGTVAARKVRGLLAAGAEVTVVAPSIGAEIAASGATCEYRRYVSEDLSGAWLVVVATDDRSVNASVHADCEAAHVWVNAADDPSSCSFILPAVVRQGPVTVAVSTSGYSPALASWMRSHVEEQLGPEFAELAEMLREARSMLKEAGRSTEEVDWRTALDWDMLELIKAGQAARARERLEACLSSSSD